MTNLPKIARGAWALENDGTFDKFQEYITQLTKVPKYKRS